MTHSRAHGSVFLTQKPLASFLPHTGSSKAPLESTSTSTATASHILIRATTGKSKEHRKLGKKEKLSTVVAASDLPGFYAKYADVCKKGMEGLRKRDKKKAKKRKKDKASVAKTG